VIAILIVIIII